jgi:hypothetical protein
MEEYETHIRLLGLRDQNLPLFKETRVKRLQSIQKMQQLITVLPRLAPKFPAKILTLDETDPEWDDKMVYPVVNYRKYLFQAFYWAGLTGFYAYNWNVLHGNRRLKLLSYTYPFISAFFIGNMIINYNQEVAQVDLFENYCEMRANELVEQNKYMLDHEDFKRKVYFAADLQETLERVHRQANNHDQSDFKDSELLLQDFIRRYSDEQDPDSGLFTKEGFIKRLN